MKQMEKQQENVKNLLALLKENPDLEILPMIDYEVCAGDEYARCLGSWGKAKIDSFCVPEFDNERIYFKSNDEDRLAEKIYDRLETENPYSAPEVLSMMTEMALEEIKWEKVIVVNINTPDRY
ncbi:hypothetical protein [Mesobacillus stamsii]|uniref:Uncharacterized protein n=1 Tax=Mesobacillus stamsii TaxID=225347 RepID=A0ABU0FWB7_9BACI|nr:hypothetical protein [Mesobacillus stamsii]MDQ0414214.1 hypothetical protein [Mesobacillus stamsii]